MLALSYELEMTGRVDLALIEQLSLNTPCITPIKPSGPYHLEDLGEAGGIQGVMKRLGNLIHPQALTVNGRTVEENLRNAVIKNDTVIRSLDNPVFSEGLYILHGNLADSAVVRPTVIAQSMYKVTGPARVFESMESCLDAVRLHVINPGDIIVLRYEGPKGGPGLTDVFKIMGYLVSLNLHESCAVITDGKVSGFAKGPFICQITPEAAEGGAIALVHEGDPVHIDLPSRRLDLLVSEEELKKRRETWKPNPPRVTKGLLSLYAKAALPATLGGGLPLRFEDIKLTTP
jgi:dihydroxy-acid dehydratase